MEQRLNEVFQIAFNEKVEETLSRLKRVRWHHETIPQREVRKKCEGSIESNADLCILVCQRTQDCEEDSCIKQNAWQGESEVGGRLRDTTHGKDP